MPNTIFCVLVSIPGASSYGCQVRQGFSSRSFIYTGASSYTTNIDHTLPMKTEFWKANKMKVLSRNENPYLGKFVADVIVSLFQVLYAPVQVLLSVPPIMHHNEPQRESLTELKQVVSLLPCPAVIMEVLLVLQIRVNWHLWLL